MGREVARYSRNGLNINQDTIDRVVARGVSKVAPLTTPWIVGGSLVPAGAVTHAMWGGAGTLPWVSSGMTLAGMALTALTWAVARHRKPLGRIHSTATTGAAAAWMTAATITGPTASPTLDVGLIGGAALALAWNIRGVIRNGEDDEATGGDRLKAVFGDAAAKAGLEGTVLKRIDRQARKVTATADLPEGNTADDLQKKLRTIESAMGLPPGSLTVVEDLDDAGAAKVTFSDPRLMREPVPYEGPSRPGASIAQPIRVGFHQDGEDSSWTILNHHTQVMGKTGVAKSFGGFWNFAGEVMSRRDAALFVADLDKGEQTVGPMRRGLHRVELDKSGVRRMLAEFYAVVRPRTDYLASKGLKEWQEGCGLVFLVLWLEEFPTIGDALDMEAFMRFMRTARSAGIHVVLSLQRSDWTQMPTFVRGQLANWCFGVANSADAAFGLSEPQQEAGVRPELWASRPGLSALDAPGSDQDRIALPLRTPMWTTQQMREHAEAFPATARPLDKVTAKYLSAGPGGWATPTTTTTVPAGKQDTMPEHIEDQEVEDVAAEYVTIEDPDPATVADIDTPIEPAAGDWEFAGGKMKPEQARLILRATIAGMREEGRDSFAPRDLGEVMTKTGMSRAWIQKHLKEMAEAGELTHDLATGTYHLRALQPA